MKLNRGAALVLFTLAAAHGFVRPWSCDAELAQDSTPRPLPVPGGNMSVATTIIRLVDSTRSARGDSSGAGKREITVQLWYPRTPTKSLTSAPYFPDARVLAALARSSADSALVRSWSTVETSALLDVDVMALPWKLPLLVFSHAQGQPRSSYTALVQDVASFGNIVAALDHPYGGITTTASGEVIVADLDTTAAGRARAAATWAADAAFVVTALRSAGNAKNASAILKHAVYLADWAKVGMFGHELGGVAALEACRRDKRFKACLSLAGEPLADAATITRPTLLMRSEPPRDSTSDQALGARQEVPAFSAQVSGFNHWSFTDYPFVYPQAVLRTSARTVAPAHAFTITSEFVRAFFGCYLQGKPSDLLRGGKSQYPEVTVNALTAATRKPCIPSR